MRQLWLSYPALGSCIPNMGRFQQLITQSKLKTWRNPFTGQYITPLDIFHPTLSYIIPVRGELLLFNFTLLRCFYLFPFLNQVRFVKLCRLILCDSLLPIIPKKLVFLSLFASSPLIIAPIDSPIIVDQHPRSNTEPIRLLSRRG